jgi:hypothetical protein
MISRYYYLEELHWLWLHPMLHPAWSTFPA